MPDPKAQIATPDEILGKGIDALVARRPRALRHINYGTGVYARIFAGWRAQLVLMLRRQADLARNGRLPFAEGAPLRFLAASEFRATAALGATHAIGQVTLTRAPDRTGGTIRQGSRFHRASDTSAERLWVDAQYVAAVDTHVPHGATEVTVPLIASRPGAFANRPLTGSLATELQIADDIVDRAAWTVTSYEAGGGSDGSADADIQRYAQVSATGDYGPNERAVLAGAYEAGAKHVITVDDVATARMVAYIADSSWAGSTRWAAHVRKSLYDRRRVGFGCRVDVEIVTNELVGVEVTCKVRDPSFLAETSSLEVAVQRAIRSYFDDRLDFNRWKTASLRGIVARADRRLLSCSSAVVKKLDGTIVNEPDASSTKHFLLVDNAVKCTFLSPT